MPVLRLKFADLQTLAAPSAEGLVGGSSDKADLETRIRRQFRFLPDPITVSVEGDEVIVEFPEETPGSRAEAERLAENASKRASEGNYGKANDIYHRVLELTPNELALHDFENVAVHEVAHALLAAHRSPRLTIWRNPSGGSIDEKSFLGRVTLQGQSTPQISIAGELANYLYRQFESECEKGGWPEDFDSWPDEYIETFTMEAESGIVSDSDFEGLRELSFNELIRLVEEVADDLRHLWPDLLRIVKILVKQFEENPTQECFGFTDWELKQLLQTRLEEPPPPPIFTPS